MKVIRVNGRGVVVEREKEEESEYAHQQVEGAGVDGFDPIGNGVAGGLPVGVGRRRIVKKEPRRPRRVLSWSDRSREVRRRVGLPVMETSCGFEVVDRLCIYASCYADDDCSGKVVDISVVVLVREIISQELVRGQYL